VLTINASGKILSVTEEEKVKQTSSDSFRLLQLRYIWELF